MKKNKILLVFLVFLVMIVMSSCGSTSSLKHKKYDCGCWSHNKEISIDADKSKV
ncbi:MAG: hypothetical protein U9R32_09695 [Bacteroidota bacterium]|nr:hypothetical protein [Bacteroidota bacterium]